jgi:SAM-dependent methyltransferase
MPTSDAATPNADQIAYWNESGGPVWVEMQAQLDRMTAPFSRRTVDALAPAAGEALLDIGCGSGGSTLELGQLVGPTGKVLGVDISVPMLGLARRRAAQAGSANVEFREADAQTADLGTAVFDGLFSRFGVMFFGDPVAAFTNLHKALKPGGRLAFVCWRTLAENAWATVSMTAALRHLPAPPRPEPGAPGAFAFADPERIRTILGRAGFSTIAATPFDTKSGVGDLEQTLALVLRSGPVGAMLREHEDKRDIVAVAVREALVPHETADGVLLDAAAWIVTATA